jgi:proteasome accessory factor A
MAFVRGYPGECHIGWDYQYESPRADLRGFKLSHLAFDPEDARLDEGRTFGEAHEVRSDRVLLNGARLYNDHGHPEYSTPECESIFELARHDCAGEIAVLNAARVMEMATGRQVRVYKNNTDFHGASYGTHESYLVPREIGFARLYRDVLPMMVARQVLVGAGKLGGEKGVAAGYQISQRADFLSEPANAETLYRRPIFNTRDEPHSDANRFIRLHVICGDANMIEEATARKAGLMKLALALCESGDAPLWAFRDPVKSFQAISQDETHRFEVELEKKSWTTAGEILESYFAAAERFLNLDAEMRWVIESSRALLVSLRDNFQEFSRHVDWAAKYAMLSQFVEQEGCPWNEPSLHSFDLEYHNVDPEEGLHAALVEMDACVPNSPREALLDRLGTVHESTRALARSIAVKRFGKHLKGVCWRTLTFDVGGSPVELDLPPNGVYPAQLADADDVGTFIEMLRGVQ